MWRPITFVGSTNCKVLCGFFVAVSLAIIPNLYGVAIGGDAPANSFYASRDINLLIGFRPGAAYDLYARLTAKYLVRHLPGRPAIIVENSVEPATKTAERIYGADPDGTKLAALIPALYFTQLTDRDKAKFDVSKFAWLGSPTKSHYLLYMRSDTPYKSMRGIRTASIAPLCGAGEPTTTGFYLPKLFEEALGTKFTIKAGYREGPDVDTAVEKGELQCRALTIDGFHSHEPYFTWMKTGFVHILLQTGAKRDPRLPNVPTLNELMEEFKASDSSRRLAKLILASSDFGRPIVAPPATPPDRAGILRTAYNRVMKDPAFVAEAKRDHLELNPTTAQELETLAREVLAQPQDVVERMKKLLGR